MKIFIINVATRYTTYKGSIDLLISFFILGDALRIFPTAPTSPTAATVPTSPQPTTGNFNSMPKLKCFKIKEHSGTC